MIEAVIFDMDGVLIDSEVEYINRFKNLFHKVGLTFSKEKASQIIGSSSERTNELLHQWLGDTIDVSECWRLWHEELKVNPIDYSKLQVEGAYDLLATLKAKGYKIGLASATELDRIYEQMEAAGLLPFFDAISSGHEVPHSKPDPGVYLKTMERLGVEPEQCIVVEDSFYGIQAGKSAGCYVIGRQVEMFNIDQRKADELITDLPQVLTIVERIQGV